MTTATQPTRHRGGHDGAERLARGLGWFSLGLGLAEITAPRFVARTIGVNDNNRNRRRMVAIGVREIASGVGLLMRPRSTGWVWARVGGDVMDLALLGAALRSGHVQRPRVAGAAAAVAGVTLLDVLTGERLSHRREAVGEQAVKVTRAITVNRPPDEVYAFWRNVENLPRFMQHLESVETIDERRSRWRAKGAAGKTVEWDAELVEDRPNELIAWRSLGGAHVPNRGSVRFRRAPDGRGTEVVVELEYHPPGGRLGAGLAKLFGADPGLQVTRDLHRFKQLVEVGEIVQSDASLYPGPHPAQPPEQTPGEQAAQASARSSARRIPVQKGEAG